MEIEFRAPLSNVARKYHWAPQGGKPDYGVYVGEGPHIFMYVDLVLTNHRTDHKERIIGCTLHLKKRHRLFWNKTITEAQVQESPDLGITRTPITNIELEPMSEPRVITVIAKAPIECPVSSLPEKMKLVLELSMVGPIRRMKRTIDTVDHDPKQLTFNKEDSQS